MGSSLGWRLSRPLWRSPQADAAFDELNAGSFERCNDRNEGSAVRFGQPAFEIHDCFLSHATVFLEVRLRPVEQTPSGASLSWIHVNSALKYLIWRCTSYIYMIEND